MVAAFAAPAALAASSSPREIYADFADNGRLDGQYSTAELERALQDAEAQGYPGAGTAPAQAAIQERLGEQQAGGVGAVGQGGGTLPFTGLDLALLTAGAGALLLLGFGFRKLGRTRT
ncbi:MAG: hypothetical protein H0V68_05220 [Actinobacteria bacterium]|nr:hypothetical protein [Actinomycetota bacterium]